MIDASFIPDALTVDPIAGTSASLSSQPGDGVEGVRRELVEIKERVGGGYTRQGFYQHLKAQELLTHSARFGFKYTVTGGAGGFSVFTLDTFTPTNDIYILGYGFNANVWVPHTFVLQTLSLVVNAAPVSILSSATDDGNVLIERQAGGEVPLSELVFFSNDHGFYVPGGRSVFLVGGVADGSNGNWYWNGVSTIYYTLTYHQ